MTYETREYHSIDQSDVDELIAICGENGVIYADKEKLEPYSHDEVADTRYHHMPDVVVKPKTTEEVSRIMKYADEHRIPVTPRAAGSGLSGGAVPACGGIVLSVERMNRIIDVDTDNLMVTVQPGVVTNEINETVKQHNLFFAGYPMSVETCFVGGNIAENAGGGKAVKYGVTGRYIHGLEAVLPGGEIIRCGGKRVKDVTGYDLVHLLTGSEGTLAVITEATIKLLPLPTHQVDLLVLFPDTAGAIGIVPKIMVETGIIPTALEYMDRLSLTTACEYLNEKLDYGEAGAILIVTVDGHSKEQVETESEAIGELCLESGAIEVYVADNATTTERIWRIRRNAAEAFKVESPIQSLEDIVVPFASIPEMLSRIERISARHNIPIPCYGHAGDGNLHATPVKPVSMSDDEWDAVLEQVLEQLYTDTAELGGTISGEHGIGSKRRKHMRLVLSDSEIALMKRIKTAFDPNGILNPGKMFE